jgi:hypothetical protein
VSLLLLALGAYVVALRMLRWIRTGVVPPLEVFTTAILGILLARDLTQAAREQLKREV